MKKSLKQLAKEQSKLTKDTRERQAKEAKEYSSLDEVAKIEREILRLQSQVNNCNYDLNGMFKNHLGIIGKRDMLVKVIEDKRKEIKKLKEKQENDKKDEVQILQQNQ